MGWAAKPQIARLTWATGAALLTALLSSYETSDGNAVYSQLICWTLILAFTELVQRSQHLEWSLNDVLPAKQQTYVPWLAAACIVLSTLSSSFNDPTWILVGFLTDLPS